MCLPCRASRARAICGRRRAPSSRALAGRSDTGAVLPLRPFANPAPARTRRARCGMVTCCLAPPASSLSRTRDLRSCITRQTSRITHHASRIMLHAACLLLHASCFMPPLTAQHAHTSSRIRVTPRHHHRHGGPRRDRTGATRWAPCPSAPTKMASQSPRATWACIHCACGLSEWTGPGLTFSALPLLLNRQPHARAVAETEAILPAIRTACPAEPRRVRRH